MKQTRITDNWGRRIFVEDWGYGHNELALLVPDASGVVELTPAQARELVAAVNAWLDQQPDGDT